MANHLWASASGIESKPIFTSMQAYGSLPSIILETGRILEFSALDHLPGRNTARNCTAVPIVVFLQEIKSDERVPYYGGKNEESGDSQIRDKPFFDPGKKL